MGHSRSSSSSSSSSDGSHKKYKKDKKDKKNKKHAQGIVMPGTHGENHHNQIPSFPVAGRHDVRSNPPMMPSVPAHLSSGSPPLYTEHGGDFKGFPQAQAHNTSMQSENYSAPPPSGYRLPLSTQSSFPPPEQCGAPPCIDADGRSPVYIGSAIMDSSVHPCKIGQHLSPTFVSVPYGGTEHAHHGRYDLLPFNEREMEWVRTSQGQIPYGRRPVEGGYEENGEKLYHALAVIQGVKVPGKTGQHLRGCNVAFGGIEHVINDDYEVLCWR